MVTVADKMVHFGASRKYGEKLHGSLSSYLVDLTGNK